MSFQRSKSSTFLLILIGIMAMLNTPAFAQSGVTSLQPNREPKQGIEKEQSALSSAFHLQADDAYLLEFEEANALGFQNIEEQNTQLAESTFAPPGNSSDPVKLPLNQQTLKIEAHQDGIYQLTYQDLVDAGIDMATADPNTIEMNHRGNSLAYQFVGDSDNQFEIGESVRFYGESVVDMPRLERQYLNNNVYWLWFNGAPQIIASEANPTGYAAATNWRSAITLEEENVWFATWTDKWALFANDPDAWFMDSFSKGAEATISRSYDVELPNPDTASGIAANFTVEVNSKSHPIVNNYPYPHQAAVTINSGEAFDATDQWYSIYNRNINGSIAANRLIDGANNVQLTLNGTTDGSSKGKSHIYTNRITFSYQRLFIAGNDQLIFSDEIGGKREFNIGGFTETDAANMVAWNVSDPQNPVAISISPADLAGGSLRIGSNHSENSQFIATTQANLLTPGGLSLYVPTNIAPVNGAQWLAITHSNFLAESEQLAQHRGLVENGGYATHVVDINDIINQYGYGLNLPEAIRDYLREGLSWDTPLQYVVLVGDSTINPRQLDCTLFCMDGFNEHQDAFIITDLAFVDRFQGLIPSDSSLAFLEGDDTILDVSIGRLPVQTKEQAANLVNKIIRFEDNLRNAGAWMENFLYLADNTDGAGNFCLENQNAGNLLPSAFNQTHFCLPGGASTAQVDQLRADVLDKINNEGALILNYRGHGFPTHWASEEIFSRDNAHLWQNSEPLAIITANCLDGFNALPGAQNQAMSETLLRQANSGSAAHWSSTGLGYLFEHKILSNAFHEALFDLGKTQFGDGIRHAYEEYTASNNHASELYAFNFQGDPAMFVMRPSLSISAVANPAYTTPGEIVDIELTIRNNGIYPIKSTVSNELDSGLDFISASSPSQVTVNSSNQGLTFDIEEEIGFDDPITITMKVQTSENAFAPSSLSSISEISPPYSEADPGDESAQAVINFGACPTPAELTVAASSSNEGHSLTWQTDASHTGYEIHRSLSPYFTPDNVSLVTALNSSTSQYQLPAGGADNYSYLVTAQGCDAGMESASNRIMTFNFELITTIP